MDKKISKFLSQKQLLSLAVMHENAPYCCSCFYAYDEKMQIFIVAGDNKTTHIQAILKNSFVSGTVVLDTKIIGKIKGVQFRGNMRVCSENESEIYFLKFPFSRVLRLQLWVIELVWVKFTDNTLGFGKKIIWER